ACRLSKYCRMTSARTGPHVAKIVASTTAPVSPRQPPVSMNARRWFASDLSENDRVGIIRFLHSSNTQVSHSLTCGAPGLPQGHWRDAPDDLRIRQRGLQVAGPFFGDARVLQVEVQVFRVRQTHPPAKVTPRQSRTHRLLAGRLSYFDPNYHTDW